jgi:hypothetical protein
LNNLQSLADDIAGLRRDTGDVPPWPVQAGDQAESNRIADAREHDRDGTRSGLKCVGGQRSESGNKHVRSGGDQFCREQTETLRLSLRGTVCNVEVLALAISELIQLFQDHIGVLAGDEGEVADPKRSTLRLLRPRGVRPLERRGRGDSNCGDEAASVHSSSTYGTCRVAAEEARVWIVPHRRTCDRVQIMPHEG